MQVQEVFRIYKLPIILGGASLFTIILSGVLLVKSIQTTAPIEFSEDSTEASGSALGAGTVAVDIEGAVVRPGFYTLPAGSRVEDAIAAAGGLAPEADLTTLAKTINRAAKVLDGGKIFIPGHSDAQTAPSSGFVSVNTASASELETLSGIGPATAKKIIDNRPYQTFEELVSKKAISPSVFEKIKEQLSL